MLSILTVHDVEAHTHEQNHGMPVYSILLHECKYVAKGAKK